MSSARSPALHPFFHCSQQITDWRLGRGVRAVGGEGYLLTGFSLDGSIRSRLFRSAWLGGKGNRCKVRGGESCRREMLVLFGCGSLTNMSRYKQSACVFWGRGFGEREPDSEREWHFQGEISEWLAVASLSRSESCWVKSHTTWPPPSPPVCFPAACPSPPPPPVHPSVCLLKACGKTDTPILLYWQFTLQDVFFKGKKPQSCLKSCRFPPGKPVSPYSSSWTAA